MNLILPPHFYATYKGVTIVEIDDQKQLANRMAPVAPYTRIRWFPLSEARCSASRRRSSAGAEGSSASSEPMGGVR